MSAALARPDAGASDFQLSAHKQQQQLGGVSDVMGWVGFHLGYDILALRISELTPLATRAYQLGRCRPTATLMLRLNSAESDTAYHTNAHASESVSRGWGRRLCGKRRTRLNDAERAHLSHCQVHVVHLHPSQGWSK